MLKDIPTVESIRALTDEEIDKIRESYFHISKTSYWKTGIEALSDVYGRLLDDEALDDLEFAVRNRTTEVAVILAVRWYFLATLDRDGLALSQVEAITTPWHARH